MYGRATLETRPATASPPPDPGPVIVGNDDGANVEILNGIGTGDQVIVRPGTTLDDGAAVVLNMVEGKSTAR